MTEYYVLSLDPHIKAVFEFITAHDLTYELHLNRTRFFVPEGVITTEFLLRFSHCCPRVDPNLDPVTGL